MRYNHAQRRRIRAVRNILYHLKRVHGVPLDYYSIVRGTLNVETGQKATPTTEVVHVARAITFDGTSRTKFDYDLAFIAANKNFTYGSTFHITDRLFIIDAQDLEADPVKETDQIVYDGKRYSIEKVQELDVKAGYIIDCRFTQAVRPRNIIERSVEQALVIEETLTNE